jgi:hypothetical protein
MQTLRFQGSAMLTSIQVEHKSKKSIYSEMA